ncbi:MAG: M2 family metallopeptidase [Elusimicrobia bacterium]|nr:M2 family metallopeptidase [Elusimicrobiota bacterium]
MRSKLARFILASVLVAAFSMTIHAKKNSARPRPRAHRNQAAAAPMSLQAKQVKAFIERTEKELEELNVKSAFANWVQATYIIHDTEKLAADANREMAARVAKRALESNRFKKASLPEDVRRKILLLKIAVAAPAPPDPKDQKELSEIQTWLEATYGKGKYCPQPDKCLTLNDMEDVLRDSRNPDKLLDVWRGWRTISPPMKEKYARFVELSNKGARQLGFRDTGILWRSGYDMSPEAFSAELDRLWGQVKPLYNSLHTYVLARLIEKYGTETIGTDGLIPAHLLGNMWAQSWEHIYPLAAPSKKGSGYDLTKILQAQKMSEKDMVKTGEGFFVSLGLDPLPQTFWERSLFTKPRDREVVCHASAWDVESSRDLRIKMCIKVNEEDFTTIHHELGHNFYQRAYGGQPFLFRGSANDGFHEALGDTIALSVTPGYLQQIGLLKKVPGPEGDIDLLMKMALERVAFLPFGLMVDQWRWKVFSGEVTPRNYNQAWWDLAQKYQGVRPPIARSEADFDPGAKYHIPANVPYTRYFLAHILEFQFYRALCSQAGYNGPLHRCSFYNDKAAGQKLQKMMAMGQSRPWPEALEVLTGSRRMDATAVLDYFAPLKAWLDEQNTKLAAQGGAAASR